MLKLDKNMANADKTTSETSLIRIDQLTKIFPIVKGSFIKQRVGEIKAVDKVSFDIKPKETFGLVGESGCGKTTTGRSILQLETPTYGKVLFEGQNIAGFNRKKMRPLRGKMQIIFQDPFGSLNPRMTVGNIIGEPLLVHGMVKNRTDYRQRIDQLLQLVGLEPNMTSRYPHEFSGGQRQRIGIARAIGVNPKFIVCDEPVSALDVSIQAQIINLLEELQERLGLTYLFIAHDLAIVRHISDRIGVMYQGRLVEIADKQELYKHPLHPYTQLLLSAVPIPDPGIEKNRNYDMVLNNTSVNKMKSGLNSTGCLFGPRCRYQLELCQHKQPDLIQIAENRHHVACHLIN